jgi:hypothetical protein
MTLDERIERSAVKNKTDLILMARKALREILRSLGTSESEINHYARSNGQKLRHARRNGR